MWSDDFDVVDLDFQTISRENSDGIETNETIVIM